MWVGLTSGTMNAGHQSRRVPANRVLAQRDATCPTTAFFLLGKKKSGVASAVAVLSKWVTRGILTSSLFKNPSI